MHSKIKHLPVNWMNGMSFSQNHLNSEYLATADSLRDTAALNLNPANYGLLGGDGEKLFGGAFIDHINNESIDITFCRAITQNGSRIEILNEDIPELKRTLSELAEGKEINKSEFWYVILIVDMFSRIPTGLEDEQEIPRRKPNNRPNYTIELISAQELERDSMTNAIPIAKYEDTPTGLIKDGNYIPPCTRVSSSEKLVERVKLYVQYLDFLKQHASNIIDKIRHKRRVNLDKSHVADDLYKLCSDYLLFYANNIDALKQNMLTLTPKDIYVTMAKMARILDHSLEMGYDKSHMLQYFRKYATELSVAQIEGTLTNVYNGAYYHLDISDSYAVIDECLKVLNELFDKLQTLDYRELEQANVVLDNKYSTPKHNPPPQRPGGKIRLKRPGGPDHIGGDLK